LTNIYIVQFVIPSENLKMRSGAGFDSPVVDTFPNGFELLSTGEMEQVGNTWWLPVQSRYNLEVSGWVDRRYVVRHVEPDEFCSDARALAIVDDVREAVRTRDAERLAQLIVPARGLWLRGYWLSETVVQNFFTESRVWSWRGQGYDEIIRGSIPDAIVPMLERDLLAENVSIACHDNQDNLMMEGVYQAGSGIEALPFYSVMLPGPPGHELDWEAWAFGIDYWERTPTLAYLDYYWWVP
jgi:hypothetical protein